MEQGLLANVAISPQYTLRLALLHQQQLGPINPDGRTGDVTGPVGSQKQHEIGDLFTGAWLAVGEGNTALWKLNRFFFVLNAALGCAFVNVGVNRARTNDVDPDTVFGQFQRNHLREGHLRGFGAGISRGARVAENARPVHRRHDGRFIGDSEATCPQKHICSERFEVAGGGLNGF